MHPAQVKGAPSAGLRAVACPVRLFHHPHGVGHRAVDRIGIFIEIVDGTAAGALSLDAVHMHADQQIGAVVTGMRRAASHVRIVGVDVGGAGHHHRGPQCGQLVPQHLAVGQGQRLFIQPRNGAVGAAGLPAMTGIHHDAHPLQRRVGWVFADPAGMLEGELQGVAVPYHRIAVELPLRPQIQAEYRSVPVPLSPFRFGQQGACRYVGGGSRHLVGVGKRNVHILGGLPVLVDGIVGRIRELSVFLRQQLQVVRYPPVGV